MIAYYFHARDIIIIIISGCWNYKKCTDSVFRELHMKGGDRGRQTYKQSFSTLCDC